MRSSPEILERCRMTLKGYEGFRAQKALEYREKVAAFQVAKKIILRKTGQEFFRTSREIEKETLSRTYALCWAMPTSLTSSSLIR